MSPDIAGVIAVILAFLGVGGLALVKLVLKKPPKRSAPKGIVEASKAEAVEREKIELVIEGKVVEVMEIDAAPDRERTRRAGSRLRD